MSMIVYLSTQVGSELTVFCLWEMILTDAFTPAPRFRWAMPLQWEGLHPVVPDWAHRVAVGRLDLACCRDVLGLLSAA
jgi:hypothetical protein